MTYDIPAKDREDASELADNIDKAGLKATGWDKFVLSDVQKKAYDVLRNAEKNAWVEVIIEHIAKIRAESAEQARKESADRVRKEFGAQEGGSNTIDRVCAAILGDSVVKENLTTGHIPDSVEKLAIAVKALKNIIDGNDLACERGESMASWMDSDFRRQAKDALKEIQG